MDVLTYFISLTIEVCEKRRIMEIFLVVIPKLTTNFSGSSLYVEEESRNPGMVLPCVNTPVIFRKRFHR